MSDSAVAQNCFSYCNKGPLSDVPDIEKLKERPWHFKEREEKTIGAMFRPVPFVVSIEIADCDHILTQVLHMYSVYLLLSKETKMLLEHESEMLKKKP